MRRAINTQAAVRALLWENLRETWWVPLIFISLAWCVEHAFWTVQRTRLFRFQWWSPNSVSWFLVFSSMIFLLLSVRERNDLSFGFPRRRYRLPLSTFTLVTVTLFFRVVVAAFQVGLMLDIHYRYFGRYFYVSYPVAFCGLLGIFFFLQAIAWYVGGYSSAVTILVGTGFSLVFRIFLNALAGDFGEAAVWLVAASVPVGYAVMLKGVSLDRRGRWAEFLSLREILASRLPWEIVPVETSRGKRFKTPARAQLWFESRRKGWIFPGFVLFFGGVWVVQAVLMGIFGNDWLDLLGEPMLVYYLLLQCAFWAALLIVLQELRDQLSGVARFLATKPITSTALGKAKLHATSRTMLVTVTFAAVLMGLWVLAHSGSPFDPTGGIELVEGLSVSSAFSLMLAIALTVLPIWVLLWGINWLNLAVVLVAAAPVYAYDVLWRAARWDLPHYPEEVLLLYWSLLISLTAIIGTVWLFYRARHKGLLDARQTAFALGAFALPYALVCLAGRWENWNAAVPTLAAGLLALSIAPFAYIPLVIHRRRHNQAGKAMTLL